MPDYCEVVFMTLVFLMPTTLVLLAVHGAIFGMCKPAQEYVCSTVL